MSWVRLSQHTLFVCEMLKVNCKATLFSSPEEGAKFLEYIPATPEKLHPLCEVARISCHGLKGIPGVRVARPRHLLD